MYRALTSLGLMMALGATGCSPSTTPPWRCEPAASPTPPPPPPLVRPVIEGLDVLKRPAVIVGAAWAEIRDGAVQALDPARIPAAPEVGAPGPVVVVADPSRVAMPGYEAPYLVLGDAPAAGPPGKRVQAHASLFAREPSVALGADGTATLTALTVRDVPAASVYFGTVVPGDALGMARHRRQLVGEIDGTEISLAFPIPKVLRTTYDIADVAGVGRGVISWRLEVLDAAEGTARVTDGTLPFRCEPDCRAADRRFVQLPTFTSGPFIDLVGATGATVSFTTDAATAAAVIVYDETQSTKRVLSTTLGARHEVALSGLAPDTRHRYHVVVRDHRGEVHESRSGSFQTAPAGPTADADFSFVLLSDSRSGHGTADARYFGSNRRVLEGLLQQALAVEVPRYIVFAGDLIDGYTTEPGAFRSELRAWQRATQSVGMHVPIYEGMGNHEALLEMWEQGWGVDRKGAESAEAIFGEFFVNPINGPEPEPGDPPYRENVYSWDYGPVHNVVLNTNYAFRSHAHREDHPAFGRGYREGFLTDAQLKWLDADLAAAKKRGLEYIVVSTHEPGFPNGGHTGDAMWWRGAFPDVLAQRKKLYLTLDRYGVRLIVNGDEHNYSRTRVDGQLVEGMKGRVYQLISGGAGAPYYAQEKSVPWAAKVERFALQQHFIRVRVAGGEAEVIVTSLSGETLDRFPL